MVDLIMQPVQFQHLPLVFIKPHAVAAAAAVQMKVNIRPYFVATQNSAAIGAEDGLICIGVGKELSGAGLMVAESS